MHSTKLFTAAVASRLEDLFEPTTAVAFPGKRIDTAPLTEWLELTIDSLSEEPARHQQLQLGSYSIGIHVFAKPTSTIYRAQILADQLRSEFDALNLEISDPDMSEGQTVGFAKFSESQVRDLSRPEVTNREIQHLLLTWRVLAQPTSFS
ncbi:hypothetical protein [Calycomorphotria hydatis]|uniref:Uncharacterized protein n=1 Tax=Calycomorphotria hydatis TaxID=2528027 RepID=A0A517TFC1_9PLAN|nr:hypothetical protein [Calycomorphotria hydatis]QDT67067.1 hypothetical protein V22_43390 [Calycomorphotria hydatis]